MSHVRKQIRDAIKGLLSGATGAGTRVYIGNVYPHESLPTIAIETRSAVRGDGHSSMRNLGMDLEVVIEIRAESTTNLPDALDAIEVQVIDALMASAGLGVGVHLVEWLSSTYEADDSHDKPTGMQTVTFNVRLDTDRTSHETIR